MCTVIHSGVQLGPQPPAGSVVDSVVGPVVVAVAGQLPVPLAVAASPPVPVLLLYLSVRCYGTHYCNPPSVCHRTNTSWGCIAVCRAAGSDCMGSDCMGSEPPRPTGGSPNADEGMGSVPEMGSAITGLAVVMASMTGR